MRRLAALFALLPPSPRPPRLLATRSRPSRTTTCSSTTSRPGSLRRSTRSRRSGVDRIRARSSGRSSRRRAARTPSPSFDAADPAAYGPDAWTRYDTLLALARERGIKVNWNVTGPGAGLGDRHARAGRHRRDLRPLGARVRPVRARAGHPLQRHLRAGRGRTGDRPGRLLVDLERAQPGRLADPAVGQGPARRQTRSRRRRGSTARSSTRCTTASSRPATRTTRS